MNYSKHDYGSNPEIVEPVYGGRILLPPLPLATGLCKKCRCRECHLTEFDHAPDACRPALPHQSKNLIWGNDEPLFLEVAAALSGIPLGTLRQLIYRREIDSRKVGRRRKVQPSALRAYLNLHKRPAL